MISGHEIVLTLNTKALESQLADLEKNAKIKVKGDFDKQSKELMQVVENLEKINRLANGNWNKNDMMSALLDISKKLNAEMGKTDKNDNLITTYQKQILVLANTMKKADKEFAGLKLQDFDFGRLITNPDKNGDISNLLKMIGELQKKLGDFKNIESISAGQLINKDFIRDYINQLEGVSKEFKDKLNIRIKPNIQIGDILIDEFDNEKVNVGATPIIDANKFIDDINQQIKDSGKKVEVGIEPNIDDIDGFISNITKQIKDSGKKAGIEIEPIIGQDDSFKTKLDTLSAEIKDKIGVEINPTLTNTADFVSEIEKIEDVLRKNEIKIGIDTKLNPINPNDPFGVNTNTGVNTTAAESANELTDSIKNKEPIISKVFNEWAGDIDNISSKFENTEDVVNSLLLKIEKLQRSPVDNFRNYMDSPIGSGVDFQEANNFFKSLPRSKSGIEKYIKDNSRFGYAGGVKYNELIKMMGAYSAEDGIDVNDMDFSELTSQTSKEKAKKFASIARDIKKEWENQHNILEELKAKIRKELTDFFDMSGLKIDTVELDELIKREFSKITSIVNDEDEKVLPEIYKNIDASHEFGDFIDNKDILDDVKSVDELQTKITELNTKITETQSIIDNMKQQDTVNLDDVIQKTDELISLYDKRNALDTFYSKVSNANIDDIQDGIQQAQQAQSGGTIEIPVTITANPQNLNEFRNAIIEAVKNIPIDVTPDSDTAQSFKTDLINAINSIEVPINLTQEYGSAFKDQIINAIGIIDVPIDPKTNKTSESVSSIVSLVNEERAAVSSAVEGERGSFELLVDTIRNDVIGAISDKTEAIEVERRIVDREVGAEVNKIKALANALKTVNDISLDNKNLVSNINLVYEALKKLSTLNIKKLDFSPILRFFTAISKKSGDDTKNFATRLNSIINSINKLQDIKIPSFKNKDRFAEFSEIIKKFPTEKRAQSFSKASTNIKAGFDKLNKIKIDNLLKPNGVISTIKSMLDKSDELKNMATILNKTSTITKEAKEQNRANNQNKIGGLITNLRGVTKEYKDEYMRSYNDTGVGAVSDETINRYNEAVSLLNEMRDLGGVTESQIKQIDSAIANSDKTLDSLVDSIAEKQKRILDGINANINSGRFTDEIYRISKSLNDFSVSSDDVANKVEPLRNLLEEMAEPSNSTEQRIDALNRYKTAYAGLLKTFRENRDKYNTDEDFRKQIDAMREARSEIEQYKQYSEMYLTSKNGTQEQERILLNIREVYQDINEAIKNGVQLTGEQTARLKEQNKAVKETMKYQSGDTFLPNNVKVTDQLSYTDKLAEAESVFNKLLDMSGRSVVAPLEATEVAGTNIVRLTGKVKGYDNSVQKLVGTWNKVTGSMSYHFVEATKGVSRLTKIMDMLKHKTAEIMAYWVGNFLNPLRLFGTIKQGISVVQEYDDAFVELRKVSDETRESLERFSRSSFKIGDSVAATGLQIQKSAAEFLRLGEGLEEATKHAKEANVLFGVSEFETIEEATEAFISMIQAYEEVDSSILIDKLNSIGICA